MRRVRRGWGLWEAQRLASASHRRLIAEPLQRDGWRWTPITHLAHFRYHPVPLLKGGQDLLYWCPGWFARCCARVLGSSCWKTWSRNGVPCNMALTANLHWPGPPVWEEEWGDYEARISFLVPLSSRSEEPEKEKVGAPLGGVNLLQTSAGGRVGLLARLRDLTR
eukprot:gene45762-26519_t